ALARALLAGARSGDVTQSEWLDGLTRMRAILTALGESEAEAEVAREQAQVLERVRWTQALDDLIPSLLQQARQRGGSEVRHHALLGVPPRVLAYRVEQSPSGGVVIGFDLDLDRLAREVLGPACATVNLEEEISLAVVDGRGSVRAYAGKDARPGDDGLLPRAAEAASVDLVDVPLWAVQVRRSTAQLASARRNRLILYGALLGLTLAAAVTGAIATLRYVRRSLELARMKSDFVSNMTHELKTPLTSIKMYGELLAMGRLKKEQKRKEYAEHIVREADRLQKLIEDVLDFARSDSGQHDYVLAEEDVADTVAEAIDLFRLSAKVRGFDLFVELPPVGELPAVDLDRDAIVRSVLNLLSNAVKYSTDERWIRVSVRRTEDDHIMISVKDRGIGIDPEDLERIFDRFYRAGDELTRAISGAGLGLSLIDQIVRAHGGEIQVESEKGVGSTFRILLPIVEEYRDNWPPEDLDVSDLQSGIELESADDLEEAAAAYEAGQGIDAESQLGKVEQESETESPTTETEAESPTVETESESPTAETESESP
ncbi:MAG TPA: hypothetical protein DEA08_39040, partial [Planctomycetes bacterium]|nr:hypothetical protein [Planctomycetota bacterium]